MSTDRPADTIHLTRVAAYGLVRDARRVLLCRISDMISGFGGMWTLPGGGVEFGEHPAEGMVREVFEETGMHVRPIGIAEVDSISGESPVGTFHSIRIIYRTQLVGGVLTAEIDGTTDLCRWFTHDQARDLDAVDLVRTALPFAFDR